jgi:type III restriction enzyme
VDKVIEVDSPIINSPFEEPREHWVVTREHPPRRAPGRRKSCYYFRVPERAARGPRGGGARSQRALFGVADVGELEELPLVNSLRERVGAWRAGTLTGTPYDGASAVTRELLELWRGGPDRRAQRLFFAQIEAAETIVFLTEAAPVYRKDLPEIPRDEPGPQSKASGARAFARFACKMATGTGKTTVMGMLAAWSILNRVAAPSDDRFSDTILVVCPNVTIRERLKELDPALGDQSLYRTRQLVPPHRMEELRRGEVMICNWHQLAKREANEVNGQKARVVKTGEAVEVIRNRGRRDERREVIYLESDRAWLTRIRREHGTGKGRSPQWLVFNDEAHHAYRRGEVSDEEVSLEDETRLAEMAAREATVWIEGLDRINRLVGGRKKGILRCLDVSATPFYIQGSGNEVGRPFPWVVSDFGLLDAIESGLVKIPQLPARDMSGAEEASYFNIWRWVEEKAEQDGLGRQLTPEKVMRYAGAPIRILAEEWEQRAEHWKRLASARGESNPVPPVFIIVCRDTALARVIYEWLAEGRHQGDYGEAPAQFRNRPGAEITVRIDSKAWEDIEAGTGSDEERRLRFILDTVGKKHWLGGKVPAEWADLVRKHNARVDAEEYDGPLGRLDETVPPGRDVRCIISVAMLSEGWDANTVTHIVGLRPFGSQLLCEQVVGRALRRRSYALQDDGLFAEETAKVFGVPFELIPFKVSKTREDPTPEVEPTHIYTVPEKAHYEIVFPIVTGYHNPGIDGVVLDLNAMSSVTVDPTEIPDQVTLNSLTAPDGRLTRFGPGERPTLGIAQWRAGFRDQQVAFRLAKEAIHEWRGEHGTAVPLHTLFPSALAAARHFINPGSGRLILHGNTKPCDLLLVGRYIGAAKAAVCAALRPTGAAGRHELPIIPQGQAGLGSTRFVDFHTIKNTYPADHCHLNLMVADTKRWEQSAGYALDTHPAVLRWVKNDHLSLTMPYRKESIPAQYFPDFIAVLRNDVHLVLETKGRYTDDADLKARAAERWVAAVNRDGRFGRWSYRMAGHPGDVLKMLEEVSAEPAPRELVMNR